MATLARTLGMDGAELRRINAIQRGDRWIFNQLQDRPTPTHPVMTGAAQMPLPDEGGPCHRVIRPGGVASPARPEYVRRAVGFAPAAKNVCLSEGAPVNSTAMVSLRDGAAVIECAAAEVGQGFVNAAIQIVQSTLGVTRESRTASRGWLSCRMSSRPLRCCLHCARRRDGRCPSYRSPRRCSQGS